MEQRQRTSSGSVQCCGKRGRKSEHQTVYSTTGHRGDISCRFHPCWERCGRKNHWQNGKGADAKGIVAGAWIRLCRNSGAKASWWLSRVEHFWFITDP